jgi:hypothetical protein
MLTFLPAVLERLAVISHLVSGPLFRSVETRAVLLLPVLKQLLSVALNPHPEVRIFTLSTALTLYRIAHIFDLSYPYFRCIHLSIIQIYPHAHVLCSFTSSSKVTWLTWYARMPIAPAALRLTASTRVAARAQCLYCPLR